MVPFVRLHFGSMKAFRKLLPLSRLGAVLEGTTMTRIVIFALNVMLFGLSAVLMLKGPGADVGEHPLPEPLANAEAVPNLV
jgi:hypothetical protein